MNLHTDTAAEAIDAARCYGYVRSPNNIHSLPGHEWYPGQVGLAEIRLGQVRIEEPPADAMNQDSWPVAYYVQPYGPVSPVLASRFATWADYVVFATRHGHPSQPGMPAFMFSD